MEVNGQDYLHEAYMNFERLAVYATLGVLLDAMGSGWETWSFWCMLSLFVLSDYLARKDGMEQGMWLTANLSIEALQDIKRQIKELEDEE